MSSFLSRHYQQFRDDTRQLVRGKPGSRFIEHHRRVRRRETRRSASGKTAVYVFVGAVLLFAGLVLSIPPGIPGFLLWLPALGFLVARLRFFAVWLDRVDLRLHRLLGKAFPGRRVP